MSCNSIEYAAEHAKTEKFAEQKKLGNKFVKTLSTKHCLESVISHQKHLILKNGKDLKIDCDAVQLVQII